MNATAYSLLVSSAYHILFRLQFTRNFEVQDLLSFYNILTSVDTLGSFDCPQCMYIHHIHTFASKNSFEANFFRMVV